MMGLLWEKGNGERKKGIEGGKEEKEKRQGERERELWSW